jgi:2-hydroxychromene-2-carboxylate isomerase
MSASLIEIGQDAERVLSVAQTGRVEKALSDATDEAMEMGVFGSPTFSVTGEVFWGDDRLEDAIRWAKGGE